MHNQPAAPYSILQRRLTTLVGSVLSSTARKLLKTQHLWSFEVELKVQTNGAWHFSFYISANTVTLHIRGLGTPSDCASRFSQLTERRQNTQHTTHTIKSHSNLFPGEPQHVCTSLVAKCGCSVFPLPIPQDPAAPPPLALSDLLPDLCASQPTRLAAVPILSMSGKSPFPSMQNLSVTFLNEFSSGSG